EHGPPAPVPEDRFGARRAQQERASDAGRHEVKAAHADLSLRQQQTRDVHDDGQADDEGHEAHVTAEAAHRGGVAPQSGIAAAAVVAGRVVDADEIAARRARDGTGGLTAEHWETFYLEPTRSRVRQGPGSDVFLVGGPKRVPGSRVQRFSVVSRTLDRIL